MHRMSMVGSPGLADDRTAVPAAAESLPGGGTAVGSLGELTPVVGVTFLLVWAATGIAAALVLRERGHDFGPAAALGLVFGPLFIPLAVQYARAGRSAAGVGPVVVATGSRAAGPVDVLVGLAGEPGATAAVLPVLGTLDRRLGRLTVARVLAFERLRDEEERNRAALDLSCASLFLYEHDPALVLLGGRLRAALLEHAAQEGYHLVVIVGRSERALLARREWAPDGDVHVPMLVVPAGPER